VTGTRGALKKEKEKSNMIIGFLMKGKTGILEFMGCRKKIWIPLHNAGPNIHEALTDFSRLCY